MSRLFIKKPVRLIFPHPFFETEEILQFFTDGPGTILLAHDRALQKETESFLSKRQFSLSAKLLRLHVDTRYPLLGLPFQKWQSILPWVNQIIILYPHVPLQKWKHWNNINPVQTTIANCLSETAHEIKVTSLLLSGGCVPGKCKKKKYGFDKILIPPEWNQVVIPFPEENTIRLFDTEPNGMCPIAPAMSILHAVNEVKSEYGSRIEVPPTEHIILRKRKDVVTNLTAPEFFRESFVDSRKTRR